MIEKSFKNPNQLELNVNIVLVDSIEPIASAYKIVLENVHRSLILLINTVETSSLDIPSNISIFYQSLLAYTSWQTYSAFHSECIASIDELTLERLHKELDARHHL